MLEENLEQKKFSSSRRHTAARGDLGEVKTKEAADADRVLICDALFKLYKKVPADADSSSTNEILWRDILNRTIDGLVPQIKDGEELSIGIANSPDRTMLDYANITITAIEKLRAQGDLSIPDIPGMEEFFGSGRFLEHQPFYNPDCIDFYESEILLYSDSVLKIGNTVNKWPSQYKEHFAYAKVK